MKTTELKQRLQELGYTLIESPYSQELKIKCALGQEVIASVELDRRYAMDTLWVDEGSISEDLFNVLQAYARTPLEDREIEKKYRIMLANPIFENVSRKYLYWNKRNKVWVVASINVTAEHIQTTFTISEIKANGIKMDGFILVEEGDK